MKKVFVVILHYKGKKLTQECLLSLKKSKKDGFDLEVVVVDNDSPEPLEDIKRKFPQTVFLKASHNLGFSGGNNLGIKYALQNGADYVLLLNNDTISDKNLIFELLQAADSDSLSGILGPKIYFAPEYEYHRFRYSQQQRGRVFWYAGGVIDWQNIFASHRAVDEVDKGQYDKSEQTDFVSGCAMFVKRDVFNKVELFDNRYFLYLEDLEFCIRAKNKGYKILYCPRAKVWHYNAGSSQVGGPLHDYFFTRNRLLFGTRYARMQTRLALLREAVRLLVNGRPWQKKGALDFFLGRWGKGSWVESLVPKK